MSMEVETTPPADKTMNAASVKIEMKPESASSGLQGKLAHFLSVVVAGAIAVAVATVLADGNSVIHLKDPQYLPVATSPAVKPLGVNHRLDELLGPTYGIGLHHDQSGATWYVARAGATLSTLLKELGGPVVAGALPSVIATDDLKHPVPFLECNNLKMAGLCAMYFGFIAEVVAVLMVVFHALSLTGLVPTKPGKVLATLIWTTLSAGFLIVICLAVGIYTATWTCDNAVIPSIKLSEHFEYNYGFVFAMIGYLSALLALMIQLNFTSTTGSAQPVTKSAVKSTVGITVGLVAAAVLSFVISGANHAYSAAHPADPNVNPCAGKKPNSLAGDGYFANVDCLHDAATQTLEQAGANVTRGYKGLLDAGSRVPITDSYDKTDLCPVNVHWHLGAEHLSVGQFDDHGKGPGAAAHRQRELAANARLGFRCHHYEASDAKFTTEYNWQHCVDMHVGETYEIHWPHSAAGQCGTEWQYQTPFYDGVFCKDGVITIAPLNTYTKIGVQAQIFTIVNDETFYKDNLIDGMIVDGAFGSDIAKYTGSTTGTSRDNTICSRYTPITWQVDRTCHMISASSFDKLCADMKLKKDDMSDDLYAHGARALVDSRFVANNQQSRRE